MTQKPFLVGDVGGTNVRLAVYAENTLKQIAVYQADNFASLRAVIETYLETLPSAWQNVLDGAVLDLATPVDDDAISLTNRPEWAFSVKQLRAELGLAWLHIINDFTALALSIPLLEDKHVLPISPNAPSQRYNGDGNIALIGPGTGLGVSGLVETAEGYMPIAGEGGHVSYGGVTEREQEITQYLQTQYGHVSAERLLSGNGIVNLYRALSHLENTSLRYESAHEISEAAGRGENQVAVEAMRHYFNILGTVTGNLALTHGAFAGVYLGGGILPKIQSQLIHSDFYPRFLAHGRFAKYLAKMPVYLITAEQPSLLGCVACHGTEKNLLYRHLGVFVKQ